MRDALPLSSATRELIRELPDLVQNFAATGELPEKARTAPEWEAAVQAAAGYVHAYRSNGPAARLPAAERVPLHKAMKHLRAEFAILLQHQTLMLIRNAVDTELWLAGPKGYRSQEQLARREAELADLSTAIRYKPPEVGQHSLQTMVADANPQDLLALAQLSADSARSLAPEWDSSRHYAVLCRHLQGHLAPEAWTEHGRVAGSTAEVGRALAFEADSRLTLGQFDRAARLLEDAFVLLPQQAVVAYNLLLCAVSLDDRRLATSSAGQLRSLLEHCAAELPLVKAQIRTDRAIWRSSRGRRLVSSVTQELGAPVGLWIDEMVQP